MYLCTPIFQNKLYQGGDYSDDDGEGQNVDVIIELETDKPIPEVLTPTSPSGDEIEGGKSASTSAHPSRYLYYRRDRNTGLFTSTNEYL